MAAKNGRVVKVLDGFELDVEGNGEPASDEAREELGEDPWGICWSVFPVVCM